MYMKNVGYHRVIREGKTYQPDVDMQPSNMDDTISIMDPIIAPHLTPIEVESDSYCNIVFDLAISRRNNAMVERRRRNIEEEQCNGQKKKAKYRRRTIQ